MKKPASTVLSLAALCAASGLTACSSLGISTSPTDESESSTPPPSVEEATQLLTSALGTDVTQCAEVMMEDAGTACEEVQQAHTAFGTDSVTVAIVGAEILETEPLVWSQHARATLSSPTGDTDFTEVFQLELDPQGQWKVEPEQVRGWAQQVAGAVT